MRTAVVGLAMICSVAAAATESLVAREDQVNAARQLGERRIMIAGCVVAGEVEDTYILKNVSVENAAREGLPNLNVIYRLDTTKGLEGHVGRLVQVVGIADFQDVEKGEVKIERNDAGETIVATKSERATIKAKMNPTDSPAAMVGTSGKQEVTVPTYKLTVESVKRLPGRCR